MRKALKSSATMPLRTEKSNSKRDAFGRVEYPIGLVKEHFNRIKQMLGAIK